MPLVCLSSPKGGVGKTTLTANLAFALQRLGLPVTVIDFDVQNALRLHFGVPLSEPAGYVAQAEQYPDWQRFALTTGDGIRLLPYGLVDEAQRQRFEHRLQDDPAFLANALHSLLAIPQMVVLADTPPGPSPALSALNRLADIRIVVLLADAASASLIPQVEQGRFLPTAHPHQQLPVYYIVNQVDRRRRLNNDTTELLQARLGTSLLGLVHRDEALAETLAMQLPIFTFDPTSAAAYDIDRLGQRLGRLIESLTQPPLAQPQG